jgi:site-specific recombinase XerC
MKTRPRSRKKLYPSHIDPSELPKNCNFDARGKGRWYLSFKDDDGKRKTCTIANASATMSELHAKSEQFFQDGVIDKQSFRWLSEQYLKDYRYKDLSPNTQRMYLNAHKYLISLKLTNGQPLSDLNRHKWKTPLVQQIIDKIAKAGKPTKAKHVKQYLSRLFNYGINQGYANSNPAECIELPKERKRQRLPSHTLINNLLAFAQSTETPDYVWQQLECASLCLLRGAEMRTMTEDQLLTEGVLCVRTKGSKTTRVEWNDRLRFVMESAIKRRDAIWQKQKRPVPFHAEDRLVFVNCSGDKITPEGWQSVWRRFLDRAIAAGIMTESEKFGLHDMKRRGATDLTGSKHDKLTSTGHSSIQQLNVYDHSIPLVKPAGD